MVTGRGLAILKGALRADKNGRAAYAQLSATREFQAPLSYEQSAEARFDALVLPGGHAKEMRPYLESEVLQRIVVRAFHDGTLVAAICHGVLLAARSIDPETNLSVHRRISIPAPGARNAIRPKISPPASWFATAI